VDITELKKLQIKKKDNLKTTMSEKDYIKIMLQFNNKI